MIIEYKYSRYNPDTKQNEYHKMEVDVSPEVAFTIETSQREEHTYDEMSRRHTVYSYTDGKIYEGKDMTDHSIDFYIISEEEKLEEEARQERELEERNERLYAALKRLSEVQQRRLMLLAEGKSLTEIALMEGVSVQSIHESIEGARKKFKKFF